MPATFLKSLTSTGVELIGLQPDVHDGDRAALAALPNFMNVGPEFQNFADTAGAMSNMDIVVTVDTAAAHLAGAMGKTVLILLAYHHDWRWNAGPERDTSVWYPSARLIRQPKLHDWDSVMAEVAAELSKRS
jgi:ADP-heptose:LPS heptosyltransferase